VDDTGDATAVADDKADAAGDLEGGWFGHAGKGKAHLWDLRQDATKT
jgi:hypothetical protein